jgi:DNA repair protein RecO (recombination protein O)
MLTPERGLVAAYVRGGRGRRMRPVLIPGNSVSARLRLRTETQLPQASIELVHSRAPILGEALPAEAISWVSTLVTAALPEQQPYPRLYEAMAGLLDAVEAAPSAIGWSAALARFELLLIAELGYGRSNSNGPERLAGGAPEWPDILSALDRSSASLFRDLLTGRLSSLQDGRSRLIERLRRAAGEGGLSAR